MFYHKHHKEFQEYLIRWNNNVDKFIFIIFLERTFWNSSSYSVMDQHSFISNCFSSYFYMFFLLCCMQTGGWTLPNAREVGSFPTPGVCTHTCVFIFLFGMWIIAGKLQGSEHLTYSTKPVSLSLSQMKMSWEFILTCSRGKYFKCAYVLTNQVGLRQKLNWSFQKLILADHFLQDVNGNFSTLLIFNNFKCTGFE